MDRSFDNGNNAKRIMGILPLQYAQFVLHGHNVLTQISAHKGDGEAAASQYCDLGPNGRPYDLAFAKAPRGSVQA